MGNQKITLIGDTASDYIGHAIALMRNLSLIGGKRTVVIDRALIMLKSGNGVDEIKIQTSPRFSISFDSTYYSFYDSVPSEFPLIQDRAFSGTPPVWPDISGEGYIIPDYLGLSFRSLADNAEKSRLTFSVPFVSSGFSDNLEYIQQMDSCLVTALFDGSVNTAVKFDGAGNENTVTIPNSFQLGAFLTFRGHYPCLFDDDMMMFYLQDGTRRGTLYGLKNDTTLTAVDVPTLSDGAVVSQMPSWGGYLRTSNFYRAISSPDAKHIYLVKSFIPVYAVVDNENSVSNAASVKNTVSITVEKRLKADMSLISTFNLANTSAAFSFSSGVHNWFYILDGAINSAVGTPELVYFACTGGTVLVGPDGTEYPVLTGNIIIQGYNGTHYINQAEPIILWLGGTTAADALACTGFDAVALQISSQDPSMTPSTLPNVADFGCRIDCMGDSDTALMRLFTGGYDSTYHIPTVSDGPLVQCKIVDNRPVLVQITGNVNYELFNS
jgi:hypothetical protein